MFGSTGMLPDMKFNEIKHRFPGMKLLVGLAALCVVAAGLKAAQGVFIPFLFAFFLAVLGRNLTHPKQDPRKSWIE